MNDDGNDDGGSWYMDPESRETRRFWGTLGIALAVIFVGLCVAFYFI